MSTTKSRLTNRDPVPPTKPSARPKSVPPTKHSARPKSKIPFSIFTKTATTTSRRPRTHGNGLINYSVNTDELRCVELADNHEMRQVNDECTSILRNKPDPDARQKYLAERMSTSPREKYFFPVATSWRYGWMTMSDLDAASTTKKSNGSK